jgi:hypothetical protein
MRTAREIELNAADGIGSPAEMEELDAKNADGYRIDDEPFSVGYFDGERVEWLASADDLGGAMQAIRTIAIQDSPGRYRRAEFGIYDNEDSGWSLLPRGLR